MPIESDAESSDDDISIFFCSAVAGAASAALSSVNAVQQAAITALAPPARQRRRQRPTLQARPETSENNWLRMIREKAAALDDASTFEAKDFRRNFRLPFPVFKQLLAAAREQTWLKCNDHDAAGRSCVPLELKLLGVLYLLGSGAPVRTVAQLMSMSEATLQRSLHAFCSDFAADRYDEWIRPSDDLEALQIVMQDYALLGLPGAVGSTDCTHIRWDRAPTQLGRSYKGKEHYTSIAYEVTVDHKMRVRAVTKGFPGAVNDKTIVRFDGYVERVRKDPFYTNMTYRVRINGGAAEEASSWRTMRGAYLIVDGGYHRVRN